MRRILKVTFLLLTILLFCVFLSSCQTSVGDVPTPQALTWAIGAPLPSAEEFFEEIPSECHVSFADKDHYSALKAGENEILLSYQTEKGKTVTLTASLTLIDDNEPPVISGVKDMIAYVGEGVAYRKNIALTDNCGGELTLTVDDAAVDTTKEGIYPVVYTARDYVGNTAVAMVSVHVYQEEITLEMLNEKIDELILELGLQDMPKEVQARTIYRFVHTDAHITYVDSSDKMSWIREAYFTLKNRKGDCFSYFALSKAFFERLGIENMDIQRLPGYTDDTHYWSLINIGLNGSDEWYHFDATRLRDISYEGCLLTDAQIEAFSTHIRRNFYIYDQAAYPSSSSVILTPRPDLDPYLQ